jgi:hypothetical protein
MGPDRALENLFTSRLLDYLHLEIDRFGVCRVDAQLAAGGV